MSSYLYHDQVTTGSTAMTASFIAITAPTNNPKITFLLRCQSSAAWQYKAPSGGVTVDVAANVPVEFAVKDPFSKFTFASPTSVAIQWTAFGCNAG